MILIIEKQTLTIVARYEGERSRQSEYAGAWGDPDKFEHVLFEGDIPEAAKPERQDGRVVVGVDADKRAEIIAERNRKNQLEADKLAAKNLLRARHAVPATPPHEKAIILLLLGDELELKEVRNGQR